MFSSRYRRIVLFFARVIVSLFFWELLLPRVGLRGLAQRGRSQRLRRMAARFRALAIRMGGVLIKAGQFLSARLDVLPEEITSELAGLQDEVPAENFADIRRVAEAELGAPLASKYAAFDEAPLAAASLGQAHRARLPRPPAPSPASGRGGAGGEAVVVKVQRPNIEALIATDLAALRTVGGWLQRYPPIRKRADVPALLAEFTRILSEEIDYLAEGRNAETFAANFKDRAGVRVPRVIWTHTTRRVLTLEDVYAIKITDYAAITAAGIDRAEVARRLFDAYMTQIFDDGFFHADPHPGNLFVSPTSPPSPLAISFGNGEGGGVARPVPLSEANGGSAGAGGEGGPRAASREGGAARLEASPAWQLTFVDFGMVGRVPPSLRAGLREAVIAIGVRDSARLVKAYQMLGVLLPHADLALLERMEAKVFERFWGRSMSELRQLGPQQMGEFAREFRGLLYTLPFQIPEDLILLGRTLAILSGMCTGLDPNFNVWNAVAPFAQKLIAEEAASGWEFWLGELEALARSLLALPRRTEAVLGQLERGEAAVRVPQLTEQVGRLELAVRRMVGGVIFAALLVGGVQLYLAGQMLFGGALFAGAALALGWVVFSGRRS
jgi:predicted unusual protein kinase regulating ubiquinone biosynthesis (AarF/ABC1/UbiB family)